MQNLKDVVKQKREMNRARHLSKRFNPSQKFTERNEELKNVIVPLSYLLNAASALGAMYAIYFAFQFLANSIVFALLICGALLFGIERLKRTVYRSYFDKLVMADNTNGWLVGVVVLIAISLGSTAFGTYKGTIDLAPVATTIQSDTTLTYLQNEAERINGSIAASERTTWKGKITRKSQSAIKEYSQSQNKLYEAIAARMGMIDKQNQGITIDHKKDVQKAAIIVLIIAILIELALLACMYFLSKYAAYQYFEVLNQPPPKKKKKKKRQNIGNSPPAAAPPPFQQINPNQPRVQVKGFLPNMVRHSRVDVIDNKVLNDSQNTTQPTDLQTNNENRKANNDIRAVVKTVVVKDANLRRCEHCEMEYIYKHNKQKYCSDNCRMMAWKKRKRAGG